jgi:hypothetical protein
VPAKKDSGDAKFRGNNTDEYIYTHKRNNSAAEVVVAATTT